MTLLATALSLLAACASPDQGTPAPESRTLVLSGVTLIDGSGAAPREGTTLVIRGSKVTRIVAAIPEDLPEDAEIVDLRGWFCVPGLIDAHTHLASDPSREGFDADVRRQLRELLGRGITDVRDMGGDARVLADLARETRDAEIPGPDIHYSAILAGPRLFGDRRARTASRGVELGTAPWMHRVGEETDVEALMQRIVEVGATGIKIYDDVSPALTERLAAAAQEHDLRAWAHWVAAPRRTKATDVVRAGVEVVSHAHMLMYDATPAQRAASDTVIEAAGGNQLFEDMRERGTILDATLIAASGLRTPPDWVHPSECGAAVVRAARAAGVLVATGSDHPGDGELPGIHLEYALLADAGLSPTEVIEAATRVSSMAIGIEEHRGTLAVGKDATMLLLDRDPTQSVAPLAEPGFVIVRGVVYSGPELRDQDSPVRPLERFPDAGK